MHYEQELFAQRTPYLQWLKEQNIAFDKSCGKQIHRLPFYSCMDSIGTTIGDVQNMDVTADEICLFFNRQGLVRQEADDLIIKAFAEHPDVVLVYADEDYFGTLRELYGIEDTSASEEIRKAFIEADNGLFRGEPWFKPDFSPDTLDSFFYIGNLFAIRGRDVLEGIRIYGMDISLCDFVRKLSHRCVRNRQGNGFVHIPGVLYTNNALETKNELAGWTDELKVTEKEKRRDYGPVSIIIPSKDNEAVLRRCLETLTAYTTYANYELIIVDNGSSDDNRLCITHLVEEITKQKGCKIQYIYDRMDFNFSRMCNIGAASAGGQYLLFLNDDIEILDSSGNWLDEMLKYAVREHVGAVGAKLYYPLENQTSNTCYKIQHVGITNMAIGPAHKLGGLEDQGSLYHGHNLAAYDMLAVTAACMLVKKSVFETAGGFDEELAVAYNDVELCFRLYEEGLYQVQANGAVLIHHESLSRGQDTSPEKQKRLACEKRRLYEKHPALEGHDPFYSPNLVQWKRDVKYSVGYRYDFDRKVRPVRPETASIFKKYDFGNAIRTRNRLLGKLYDRVTGYNLSMLNIDSVEEDGILLIIKGWFVLQKRDNADLHRRLWLIRITRDQDYRSVYEFPISPQLRSDVEALFAEDDRTEHTALAGIQLIFDKNELMNGTYQIGVVTDRSGLVCDESKVIEI